MLILFIENNISFVINSFIDCILIVLSNDSWIFIIILKNIMFNHCINENYYFVDKFRELFFDFFLKF